MEKSGSDDVNHARELLTDEIKREVKVDWKRARTITLRQMIETYDTNPMNLAGTTLKIRMRLIGRFKKTRPFGLGFRMRHGLFELAANLFIRAPVRMGV